MDRACRNHVLVILNTSISNEQSHSADLPYRSNYIKEHRNYEAQIAANLPEVNRSRDAARDAVHVPRIMCLLFTTSSKYLLQARAVNDTWGQRCDIKKWFISSAAAETPRDVVALPIPDGREKLTEKTHFAIRHAYVHFHDKADWFLKADDDTYIIMENLKAILSVYDHNAGHYIGGPSSAILPHGYNGGGAGYVLSKEAVRMIVEEGPRHPERCRSRGEFEDVEIGRCLSTWNVHPIDTRDLDMRLTFHPDHPYKIFANVGDARRTYTYRKHGRPYPNGIRTMSPFTVSFHSVQPGFMYMYDFLLYDLHRSHQLIRTYTEADLPSG